jgi:hypothetical protein
LFKKNDDLELIKEEDDADEEAVFIESGHQRSHEAQKTMMFN